MTLSFFQVLFLASLLLSSCHGQEYPTKVDLFTLSFTKICQKYSELMMIQSVFRQLSSLKVVCQNLSWDYSIAILVDDAWIMYQAISI